MVASIDTEALRRKYAEERDKRLRPDGNDQYLRLTGELAHGPEILAHCQRIGSRFGLYDDVLFHSEVTALSWDEARARR
jgi:hypothetical protein